MSRPLLPQHDSDADARLKDLQKARKRYAYTFDKYAGLAMLEDLPRKEQPSLGWNKVVFGALAVALKNSSRADRELGGRGKGLLDRAREFGGAIKDLLDDRDQPILQQFSNDVFALLLAGTATGPADGLEDYSAFFQTVPVPEVARRFQTDRYFSRKAVCGANPESLSRVSGLEGLPAADEHLVQVSPGDTLAAALAEGRLFESDYGVLEGLVPNTLGGGPTRRAFTVRVVYVVPPGSGTLAAFAIQIEPGGPIFSPRDDWGWQIAKAHASVADTIAGALWFHHARTHVIAEPMAISLHRQFSERHPLYALLLPHFEGMLSINEVGYRTVFAASGALDWFTGATQASVREMVLRSVQTFSFDDSVLQRNLALRGVDDSSVLSDFPFRDDALLIWGALNDWVREYVEIYYTSDADVLGDVELQAWLAEITATDGGNLQGIGQDGAFRTRDYLIQTLTQIIYSGSALHSAMNYPVSSEMAFVPNSPFAIYGEPPDRREGWTEEDWLAVFPPLDATQRQFGVAYLLGESRYGELGDYDRGAFDDPRVETPLARFKAALAQIELTIDQRNTEREPYIHLKPSRITPSINI